MYNLVSRNGKLDLVCKGRALVFGIVPKIVYRECGQSIWKIEEPLQIVENGENKFIYNFLAFKLSLNIDRRNPSYLLLDFNLVNTSQTSFEMARINCLDGVIRGKDKEFNASALDAQLVCRYEATLKNNDICDGRFCALDDPYYLQNNWLVSQDTAILKNTTNRKGLVIGFCGAKKAFGEIGVRTCCGRMTPFYAAMLLDNIIMDAGEDFELDSLLVTYQNYNDGYKKWAEVCGAGMECTLPDKPLTGYCSWYQYESSVTQKQVEQAIVEFTEFHQGDLHGNLIQLDDGYQVLPGIWEPNNKFPELDRLPEMIRKAGGTPGIWMAPTTIACNHPLLESHPEIIQRDKNSGIPFALSNWWWCDKTLPRKYNTYFLDPDHPISRRIIQQSIKQFVDMGFEYIKVDFTHNLVSSRNAYDKKKTTFETMQSLYQLIREAAGRDVQLCACVGGIPRYAIGLVNTVRIGGDVGADFEQVKSSLSHCALIASATRQWWQPDPDVYYMREENSHLTPEENFLWTGSVAIMGGTFITSDFPSQWDAQALERLAYIRENPEILSPIKVEVEYEGQGIAALIAYDQGCVRIGIYNWSDQQGNIGLKIRSDLRNGKIKRIFPNDVQVTFERGYIHCQAMPAHSLRIIELI